MNKELRRTGNSLTGDVPWGTHFCLFYKTKEDLLDILVPYFRAGLEDNEFCMWVTSEPLTKAPIKKAMKKAMPDFDEYLWKGQIEILSYKDWYVRENIFDSQCVLNGWVEKHNKALAMGFKGLRLTGNTFWLEKKDWRDFMAYEEEINSVIGNYQMMALCTYSLNRCDAAEVIDVVRTHQFVLINREGSWHIIETSEDIEHTKDALQRSEERYRALFENSFDAIILTDPMQKGKILSANSAACRMLQRTEEELIGLERDAILDSGDIRLDNMMLKRDLEKVFTGELTFKRKDGSLFPGEISSSLFRDKGSQLRSVTILRDVSERKQLEAEMKWYASFPPINPNPVTEVDLTGRIHYCNPAAEKLFPNFCTHGLEHPWLADWEQVAGAFLKGGEKTITREVIVEAKWYRQSLHLVPDTQYVRIYGFDITDRKREEEEIRTLNRTLRALSNSNQALMCATEEAEYLQAVCKIIIEDCGHAMVWIGYAEKDESKSVRPVAYAGFEEGYLKSLQITWADTERGRGPTGTAIRTGEPSMCRNMLTDPAFAPWREEALKRGYASSISLPLLSGRSALGAITIYAIQPDTFSENEVNLLMELADDLAYGITFLRMRAAHAHAEDELQKSIKLLETVTKGTEVIVAAQDTNFRYIFFNDAYKEEIKRLTGKDINIGSSMAEAFAYLPEQQAIALKEWGRTMQGESANYRIEFGDPHYYRRVYSVRHTPIRDEQGNVIGAGEIAFDVTAQVYAEEALHKSEATMRGILNASKESIWLFSSDGVVITCNETALIRFGKSADDVIGKHFNEILDAELAESRLARLKEVVKTGQPVEFEDERSGIIFHHSFYPVTDANGCVNSITCFSRDITDYNEAEKALRESEARFRLLSTTAGRLLGSDDPQAIIEDLCRDVMAHLDCQAFFNFLVDEKAGRLRLNACAGISDEDARAIKWLDYGVAVCGCVARDHIRIIADDIFHTPDARTELIKSYGIQAYCCHPLMAQDRLIGTLSFGTKNRPHFTPEEVELMRRVTDQVAVAMQRKQAEQNLQESKDYLEHRIEERTQELKAASLYTRRLIETNLDPLVTISASGKITDVNVATELVTGLSRSDLLGSDFSDYFTEPEKARAGYKKVFEEGFVRDYPLAIRHRSGRVTEVLYNASTYRNEEGDIQGVFAAARDVTELRQAQNELRKSYEELERRVEERTSDLKEKTELLEVANKELESFSYSVSHDLRAPLRAIDGYARMILKKEWGKFDEDTTRKFNAIRSNAHMMGQLIDDLLSFSRLSKKQMSASKLDMENIIMDVWKELQIINPERNMTLTIHSMPSGYGDRTLIKQVCSNLLANAVKFTKNQYAAHIEVGGFTDDDGNICYVKDNGVGFDMAYYEKLFGIFQRLHSVDDFEGTGVGLATVQRIIHRHGGRVWAEGKVNEGATFYFTLPGKEE
ncbi:MAG: PAS domain S-box protein [Syntrophaceae bacterium]